MADSVCVFTEMHNLICIAVRYMANLTLLCVVEFNSYCTVMKEVWEHCKLYGLC